MYIILLVLLLLLYISIINSTIWNLMNKDVYEKIYNKEELLYFERNIKNNSNINNHNNHNYQSISINNNHLNNNKTFPSVCTFGRNFYGNNVLTNRKDIGDCLLRNIHDRTHSIHSLWGEKGLYQGYIDTLLLYLVYNNINTIIFIGDSIAGQNVQSFVCDILRNSLYFQFNNNQNIYLYQREDNISVTYKHKIIDKQFHILNSNQLKYNYKFSSLLSKKKNNYKLNIKKITFAPKMCLYGVEICTNLTDAIDIYYNTSKTFLTNVIVNNCNNIPNPYKCIILYNQGLYWHSNWTRPFNSKGMVPALLELAKQEIVNNTVEYYFPSEFNNTLHDNNKFNFNLKYNVSKQLKRKHYLFYRETTSICFNRQCNFIYYYYYDLLLLSNNILIIFRG